MLEVIYEVAEVIRYIEMGRYQNFNRYRYLKIDLNRYRYLSIPRISTRWEIGIGKYLYFFGVSVNIGIGSNQFSGIGIG